MQDTLLITGRNLTVLRRLPQLLVFATVQPVLFVLMFRHVFGGAIAVPGQSYVNCLMPGIFASSAFVPTQTMPAAVNAVRALVLGGPAGSLVRTSLAWSLGILAVAPRPCASTG